MKRIFPKRNKNRNRFPSFIYWLKWGMDKQWFYKLIKSNNNENRYDM